MKLTTDRILDDLLDISERLEGPAPRFLKLLDQALGAKLEGDGEGLAVTLFRLGLVLGTDEHRKLTLGDHRHRQRGKAGGKMNAKTDAEMRRQLKEWDGQIQKSGITKLSLALTRCRIPRSTYYKYKKLVSK